ncbi:MAG: aminoglycoside phosphotransferase family protein [Legionella sp.]|nr:aminoglycoside phosphotransferase family protein [Legionella sp.]
MKNYQIESICSYFKLGMPTKPPKRIYGGLLHVMWHLQTDKNIYAVKQLSKDINLSDDHIVENYNLTEHIASQFIQKGIPAVCATEQAGNYLFIIDDVGFLVYPWIVAKALDKDIVSESPALQIAVILARLHEINLQVPEILEPEYDIHTNDNLIALTQRAEEYRCSFSMLLNMHLADLLSANTAYHQAVPVLKKHSVVSHGDLDQKNVLWDKANNPILIDWECARKLNPTYEIVNGSLDWSGITTQFNPELFNKMIQTYKIAGGIINKSDFEASFYDVLGNWINWFAYNIERSCNPIDSEQRLMGIEQVTQVIPTILRINDLIKKLV